MPHEQHAAGGLPGVRVSLRRNFIWTFAGNSFFGASQWAILSLIAKLGSRQMLGDYALALALVTPVVMLSHLNLRAVLATDVREEHPFGDYLAVRMGASALALAAVACLALLWRAHPEVAWSIFLLGISLTADTTSDTFYGALQRREQMNEIAHSMIARGMFSLALLAAVLWITGRLVPAVAALAAGRVLVLLIYDVRRGSAGQRMTGSGFKSQWLLFRTALPLGLVLMLVSLAGNLPRYAVEAFLGTAELGAFAAAAAFLAAGSTVVNALGQASTARLARLFSAGDYAGFRRMAVKLASLALGLGLAGVGGAALAGRTVLGLVYSPELEAYSGLLVKLMVSGIFVYGAIVLGYISTSTRSFLSQMPLLALVAGISGGASWVLVPRAGLDGAAVSVALAASVQIAGQLWIVLRALKRRERQA